MPEFRLRIWAEQVLFDCNDYVVEADTLEDAAALLWAAQQAADDGDDCAKHTRIRRAGIYGRDEVVTLDPEEIVDGDQGLTLIDEDGNRMRDLMSVPAACVQLGELLDFNTEVEFVNEDSPRERT